MAALIPHDFAQQVIGFVRASAFHAKKAQDELQISAAREKRAADKIPGLVEHFLKIGTVKPTEKEAALRLLIDPGEVLDLLKIAHDRVAVLEAKVAALSGKTPESGAATKEAAIGSTDMGMAATPDEYNSLTDPYVGAYTSRKKASDYALAKGLN